MKIFQKGFNYSQDGDGNRLVYHLQGCNMDCPWCANPEGMSIDGVLVTDEEWLLETVCPRHAILGKNLNRSLCAVCDQKECITRHKTKGIRLSYTEQSLTNIVGEAKANEMMFFDGGGITFTGGEVTMQFAELSKTLKALKAEGFHTAVETNGTHGKLPGLFPDIDQLIMDCKFCDLEKQKKYTGVSGDGILRNIRKAAGKHPYLHIRVPLIGGVNDDSSDLKLFLEFLREISGSNVTFEVLRYHEFGKKKWEQCGLEYTMTQEAYVSDETYQSFRRAIVESGGCYKKT